MRTSYERLGSFLHFRLHTIGRTGDLSVSVFTQFWKFIGDSIPTGAADYYYYYYYYYFCSPLRYKCPGITAARPVTEAATNTNAVRFEALTEFDAGPSSRAV